MATWLWLYVPTPFRLRVRRQLAVSPDVPVSAEEIPQEVRSLIMDHIESVVQLEALLLLHANPQTRWTAEQVGKELRIDLNAAREQLFHLAARGLVSRVDAAAFQYASRPDLDTAVGGLAQAYADRRVSVITLIFSKPVDKLRSFADAFKLRRDNPRG